MKHRILTVGVRTLTEIEHAVIDTLKPTERWKNHPTITINQLDWFVVSEYMRLSLCFTKRKSARSFRVLTAFGEIVVNVSDDIPEGAMEIDDGKA